MFDDAPSGVTPVCEEAGQMRARGGIGEGQSRDCHEPPPRRAARELQHHENRDRARGEIERGGGAGAGYKRLVHEDDVPAREQRTGKQQRAGPAIDGDGPSPAWAGIPAASSDAQEGKHGHQSQVYGPLHERGEWRKAGSVQVEECGDGGEAKADGPN